MPRRYLGAFLASADRVKNCRVTETCFCLSRPFLAASSAEWRRRSCSAVGRFCPPPRQRGRGFGAQQKKQRAARTSTASLTAHPGSWEEKAAVPATLFSSSASRWLQLENLHFSASGRNSTKWSCQSALQQLCGSFAAELPRSLRSAASTSQMLNLRAPAD